MSDISKIKLPGTEEPFLVKAIHASLEGTPTAPTAAAGTNTTQIATTAFVKNAVDGIISVVDMTSYSVGDTVPDDIVSKLRTGTNSAKYNTLYYQLASDYIDSSSGNNIVLYTGMNSTTGGSGLYISKISDQSNWVFGGIVTIVIVGYDVDGVLNIDVANDISSFRVKNGEKTVRIYHASSSQTSDDITLTLPHVSGTIALLSDISELQDPTYQQVINALGFTPYDSENPEGYISGINSTDVVTALGYTPYNSTNPNGYISGINASQVTTALGYVPYNSTNPNGYITGISSSDVTTALGYTPYNNTNPDNFVNASTTSLSNYYTKTQVDGMVANRFQAQIVEVLPASGISTSTIYMVLQAGSSDTYDEYMYINNAWAKIGSTSVDMSQYAKTEDLHNVALTGQYSALLGKPDIPDDTSDLTNGAGYITNSVSNLTNYTKTEDLAAVALTGSYSDLSGTPTIPSQVSSLTNDSGYLTSQDLATTNISTFINNVPYATLNDVEGLENIDVDEINRAIAAMQNIGTVTQVTGGTGLSGSGNTTVTINHSNSVTAEGTYPTGTVLENGGSFTVRDVQYDTEGHITQSQNRTITMTQIPSYDDTAVRGLISAETTAREALATRVSAEEYHTNNMFSQYVFCTFGIEPYIDPTTLEVVSGRYYQRSDTDTGIFMDNYKIDVHLKAWLKYHFGIESQTRLKNVTCYVFAMGDHGEYVNHMVTYWSQFSNPDIDDYPLLCQTGCFIDGGYGSVKRFTTTEVGAILSDSTDGYIQADATGTGKGFVSGWNTLTGRVSDLEDRPQYSPSDTNPVIDGTATPGALTTFSRGDHVHPTDTTRQSVSNLVSSWNSTTTNTHYPSEKLVKDTTDALDTRVTTLETSKSVIYLSTSSPSSSVGNNGDVYIVY